MKLEVFAERGGSRRLVGAIETVPGAGESFTYDRSWLESSPARPLSLSLPLQREPFRARDMRPYFEGLLPEGRARDAVARRLHVSSAAYLKMLAALGGECIGAISVGEPPSASQVDIAK